MDVFQSRHDEESEEGGSKSERRALFTPLTRMIHTESQVTTFLHTTFAHLEEDYKSVLRNLFV